MEKVNKEKALLEGNVPDDIWDRLIRSVKESMLGMLAGKTSPAEANVEAESIKYKLKRIDDAKQGLIQKIETQDRTLRNKNSKVEDLSNIGICCNF